LCKSSSFEQGKRIRAVQWGKERQLGEGRVHERCKVDGGGGKILLLGKRKVQLGEGEEKKEGQQERGKKGERGKVTLQIGRGTKTNGQRTAGGNRGLGGGSARPSVGWESARGVTPGGNKGFQTGRGTMWTRVRQRCVPHAGGGEGGWGDLFRGGRKKLRRRRREK